MPAGSLASFRNILGCVQQGPLIHEGRENEFFFFSKGRVFQKLANNHQTRYSNFRMNRDGRGNSKSISHLYFMREKEASMYELSFLSEVRDYLPSCNHKGRDTYSRFFFSNTLTDTFFANNVAQFCLFLSSIPGKC